MNNIANILKDAPKGTKLYSPIWGETLYLEKVTSDNDIKVYNDEMWTAVFNEYGQYQNNSGECLLFPSKEVREWDNFTLKKEYEFKPFDKVIVRNNTQDKWTASLFSHYIYYYGKYQYACINGVCTYCLPYNEETAKLIGTTDNYNE